MAVSIISGATVNHRLGPGAAGDATDGEVVGAPGPPPQLAVVVLPVAPTTPAERPPGTRSWPRSSIAADRDARKPVGRRGHGGVGARGHRRHPLTARRSRSR